MSPRDAWFAGLALIAIWVLIVWALMTAVQARRQRRIRTITVTLTLDDTAFMASLERMRAASKRAAQTYPAAVAALNAKETAK